MTPLPRSALLRWAAGISAALVAFVIAVAIAAWWLLRSLDFHTVIARVENVVEDATGRALTIGSKPELALTPMVKLVVRDVRLANQDGGTRPEMLKLQQVEIGVDLKPLVHARPPGLNIVLVEPELWLEVTEKGQPNWVLKLSSEQVIRRLQQAVDILSGKVTLDSVRIERATVGYNDRKDRQAVEVKVRAADLQIRPDAIYQLALEGALNGHPVTIGSEFRLPSGSEPLKGRASAALPGTTLAIDGVVRTEWPTEGTSVRVSAAVSDPAQLAAVFGLRLGKFPPVKFDFSIRGTAKGLRAEALQVSVGRTALNGTIELAGLEPRPRIRAEFEAKVVDLGELLHAPSPDTKAFGPSTSQERIFSATPLPWFRPPAVDVDMRLRAGRLVLPGSRRIDALQAAIALAPGRLRVDPFSLSVGSGRVSGLLRVDSPQGKSPAVRAQVQMKGVELDSLITLAGLQGAGIRNAPTDMTIDLATNGDSVRAWMAGLNGQVRVVVGPGRLPGKLANWSGSVIGKALDIANPYRSSDDGSSLKCAVVNVPVQRGVISIKDTIAGETDKVVGAASGTVDLGQERLDLILHSQAVGGIGPGLADFASAGKLTGTFAKPELAVNVQGAAVAGLRIGAAIATLGITELAGSAARKAMPPHPCETALGAKLQATNESAQPAGESGASEKKPGLFGRILGK